MFGDNAHAAPPAWAAIQARTAALGFDMPSEANTGALLRLLAASRPEGHQARVDALVERLDNHSDLVVTRLAWASGLIIAARR
ncbi:hypothetical protein [Caulobacter segnis]